MNDYLEPGKKDWSPLESWKHHERPLLDALHIGGSVPEQFNALLAEYRNIQAGGWDYVTPQEFAGNEATVNTAVVNWPCMARGQRLIRSMVQ